MGFRSILGSFAAFSLLSACATPQAPAPAAPPAPAPTVAPSTPLPATSSDGTPYNWKNVTILGGGFVTGVVFSPAKANVVYARTDVGGVYRLDPGSERWQPLLDWVGRDKAHYLGIESLALDPTNPDRNTYSASISDEDDYRSLALGFERAQTLTSQLTLGYGFSYSDDQIEPTDPLEFDRIAEADKHSASAFASLAWVLDRASVLQAGLGKLDLVTREEFDVQRAVLARTREKLEALERQLAELASAQSGDAPQPPRH